jgi:ATP:ADP antiporter, AAA family
MTRSNNPFRQFMSIRREELPQVLLMFSYFFLVITSFWILKPLKKSAFVEFYRDTGFHWWNLSLDAAQAELIAKVANMFVALAAATVFAYVSQWFRRQQLTYVFSGFILACYLYFIWTIHEPRGLTVWSFYLFGDLYSTLMVATFFAFLNDSVDPEKAKRVYGLIGLGGVAGGALGSSTVAAKISDLTMQQWLWICSVVALVIVGIAAAAGKLFARDLPPPEPKKISDSQSRENPATAGARLVFHSRYLMAIVAIVGLYEMVSTIMDFQFTSTVAHYLQGPAIGAHISRVFAFTNWMALLVQFFLASFVMTRFGVGPALLFLPVAALMGSSGFLLAPLLLVGSLLNTADNAFSYSINQSAKEVLYVPTTPDEKYKAKAFIDMFIQRFAKALAVGLSLLITLFFRGFESVRWLSLVTIVILVFWIAIARYAGREFRRLTSEDRDLQPVGQAMSR